MFILASFARSKVGEYGTYFDENYANPVLSNLDSDIVCVSACECACVGVCVCSFKNRITREPQPYGTSGNSTKFPFFPDQIISVPFKFSSEMQMYKH